MAFVTVQGTVASVFASKGFSIEEHWQSRGEDRKRRWSVFPKEPTTVTVGQQVKVNGSLGAKVATDRDGSEHVFTGRDGVERHTIDLTVGNATVDASQQPQAAAQQPGTAQQVSSPGWGTNGATWGEERGGDEIPF